MRPSKIDRTAAAIKRLQDLKTYGGVCDDEHVYSGELSHRIRQDDIADVVWFVLDRLVNGSDTFAANNLFELRKQVRP